MTFVRGALYRLAPAFLTGFTFGDWIRELESHRWDVDGVYVPRAVLATAGTLATSLLKAMEDRRVLASCDEETWRRPLFILGLPRSGTTYLFDLFARDARFCCPTRLDVFNPHTFVTLRTLGMHRVMAMLPAQKRPADNVRNHWLSPEEDVTALRILSGRLPQSVFPRHSSVDGGEMLSYLDPDDTRAFRDALTTFTRKLAGYYRKPLVLKSPSHTLRIPDLLDVFPDARFVTILREPRAQFASWLAARSVSNRLWAALQRPHAVDSAGLVELTARSVQRYFSTRSLIPQGHLVEIRFEDLIASEAQALGRIHSRLGLPLPDEVIVSDPRTYRRNAHPALDDATRTAVQQACAPLYDEGFYSREDGVPGC